MKKMQTYIFLSILLLISTKAFAYFTDVSSSHLYYNAINYVQKEAIVKGYSDNTYKPNNLINRAEFTKIIVEAQFDAKTIEQCIVNSGQIYNSYVYFTDVPNGEWFAQYICVAKEKAIIDGYADGTFHPDSQISFAEISKMLINAFSYTVDADEIWFKPYVEKLEELKAIPTTIEGFNYSVNRGELAEMIYRIKAGVTNKSFLTYDEISKMHID